MANNLAHPKPDHRATAPVKRWQRSRIGELWQLDATPHPWFPNSSVLFPMLNMLDDCSRVFTGSKIYERELLLAYLDFLPAAFTQYGMPLEIYVDFHSLFFTHDPHALTRITDANDKRLAGIKEISESINNIENAQIKLDKRLEAVEQNLKSGFAAGAKANPK